MYGKTHRQLRNNQQYMGNITGKPVTYSGNIDVGIREFAGMGYNVDDMQMIQTDESQMMTSHGSCTSQLLKSVFHCFLTFCCVPKHVGMNKGFLFTPCSILIAISQGLIEIHNGEHVWQ